jgi:starch phosphorylase
LLEEVLPRHLELIYKINFYMIEKLKKDFPDKGWLWQRMSLIEET